MTGRMLSRVWIRGTVRARMYNLLLVCICLRGPLCHLYLSHHVVIRLHVHGEGLPHLSLAVVQDLNLNEVLLLGLLELDVLDTETVN